MKTLYIVATDGREIPVNAGFIAFSENGQLLSFKHAYLGSEMELRTTEVVCTMYKID